MPHRFAALQAHQSQVANRPILSLFDDQRAQAFSVQADGMLFDFSKTNIDAHALAQLLALSETAGLAEKRAAMFGGQKINDTEGRAVLHTALRASDAAQVMVDGVDVMPEVRATRARMVEFANAVRSGVGAFTPSTPRIRNGTGTSSGTAIARPASRSLALLRPEPLRQPARVGIAQEAELRRAVEALRVYPRPSQEAPPLQCVPLRIHRQAAGLPLLQQERCAAPREHVGVRAHGHGTQALAVAPAKEQQVDLICL